MKSFYLFFFPPKLARLSLAEDMRVAEAGSPEWRAEREWRESRGCQPQTNDSLEPVALKGASLTGSFSTFELRFSRSVRLVLFFYFFLLFFRFFSSRSPEFSFSFFLPFSSSVALLSFNFIFSFFLFLPSPFVFPSPLPPSGKT